MVIDPREEPPRTERSDRLADLEAERDRLAEEVKRLTEQLRMEILASSVLREEVVAQREARLALHREVQSAVSSAHTEERARIRRELEAFVETEQRDELVQVGGTDKERFREDGWKVIESRELLTALDRIVPGEG